MTGVDVRWPARRVRPFTPAQESAAALSGRTVGRDEVLKLLADRLASAAASRNRPHTLLVGPRGSGKTHLMSVAIHRARGAPKVADRLAFIRFDEDAVGITRYSDLLQVVLSQLDPAQPGRRTRLPDNPEEAVADALNGKVLVLVIENLDRIFHNFGEGGQQDFRSWVENSGQIMVLASTPMLFPGVSDRALPWWGNFGISHLDELDLDGGRELLIKLAAESGDAALVVYLATDKGEARLRALNALAGGSPRIWMILSECLTVELLDELVPAVEALLEGLVPYYQQLLWDLSPVEQRLIRELADGPHQAMTVTELAEAAGIAPRVAATTLGRLVDIRWVRPEKAPELDQRPTWYRLREPMLRHHFHYRAATDQPLPLIVEILKAWYDPADRQAQLVKVEPGSQAEHFLAAALSSEPFSSDDAYNDQDVDRLLVEARRWAQGADADFRTKEAGVLIDLIVQGVRSGPAAMRSLLAKRELSVETLPAATALVEACPEFHGNTEIEQVGALLRRAASESAGRTQLVLELISACWDGPVAASATRDRLRALAKLSSADEPLGLDIRREYANWTGEAGDAVAARDGFAELVQVCGQVLGAEHRDTLSARANLARWSGEAGDAVAARDGFAELVPIRERVFGAEHRGTLIARANLAHWSGMAGDAVTAKVQLEELVPVLSRVFGVRHQDTERVRLSLTYWLSVTGNHARAFSAAAQLMQDHSNSDVVGLASALLGYNLSAGVREDQAAQDDRIALGVEDLLVAAVDGSAEALVRLPSELVPIVEELRAQRSKEPAPT